MKRIQDSLYLFEVCARRAVEAMLGVPTRVSAKFDFSTTFSNPYDLSCVVRSGNNKVSASVTLGIENADLEQLLPDSEFRLDAIMEITNVIAGNSLGNPLFSSSFGNVVHTLPAFFPGKSVIPETFCVQGILQARSVPLFLGIRVEPAIRDRFTAFG